MKQPFFFMLTCMVMCLSIHSKAQEKELPSWVAMIDDPKVNYFVAVQTFTDYWKGKTIWDEEEEMFERPTNKKEAREEEKKVARLKKELKNMTVTERQEYDILKYHYKRFKQWAFEMKPFVQEDGRILSEAERMAIWENSKP